MKPALALQILDPELESRLRDQMDQVEVALRDHVESEAGFVTKAARHLLEAGRQEVPAAAGAAGRTGR